MLKSIIKYGYDGFCSDRTQLHDIRRQVDVTICYLTPYYAAIML